MPKSTKKPRATAAAARVTAEVARITHDWNDASTGLGGARQLAKRKVEREVLGSIYSDLRDALGVLDTVIHSIDTECHVTSTAVTLEAAQRGLDAATDRIEAAFSLDHPAAVVGHEILEALCIVELAAFALNADEVYKPETLKAGVIKTALMRVYDIIDAESQKLDGLAVGQKPDGSSERPAAEQRA